MPAQNCISFSCNSKYLLSGCNQHQYMRSKRKNEEPVKLNGTTLSWLAMDKIISSCKLCSSSTATRKIELIFWCSQCQSYPHRLLQKQPSKTLNLSKRQPNNHLESLQTRSWINQNNGQGAVRHFLCACSTCHSPARLCAPRPCGRVYKLYSLHA